MALDQAVWVGEASVEGILQWMITICRLLRELWNYSRLTTENALQRKGLVALQKLSNSTLELATTEVWSKSQTCI